MRFTEPQNYSSRAQRQTRTYIYTNAKQVAASNRERVTTAVSVRIIGGGSRGKPYFTVRSPNMITSHKKINTKHQESGKVSLENEGRLDQVEHRHARLERGTRRRREISRSKGKVTPHRTCKFVGVQRKKQRETANT